ncbi:MAG TPA: NAD(P)/FAD-dependent oxidoreductase [Pirellulales bacterium]|nr:NAD(P)/FAD-dependent oxidoreductase [Pirellulales bacterium]
MVSFDFDCVVVGAGAAGLLAAARLAERGKRTLLLEKNPRPGVKILMSGGTRCNLTHDCDRAGIMQAFGRNGRFLHSALAALGPRELIELFELEGVGTKVEPGGKIFPVSDRATDVLDALLRRFDRSGATLALGEPLTSLSATGDGVTLTTPQRTIHAGNVLITTGGQSYPRSGTRGDGYRWAVELGHTIVTPRPALTPLVVELPWLRELQGVTVPDMVLSVIELPAEGSTKPRTLVERRGSLLFAHFGLTGPTALDVSREVSGHAELSRLRLVCDFWTAASAEQLDARLRDAATTAGKKQVAGLLADELPRRLIEALFEQVHLPLDRRAAELGKAERQRIVDVVKRQQLPVHGTRGFGKAEVTAGGVSLDEIDSRTMQSKLVPNVYFAGEVLDLDGWIGGYNFQAAFSTGWLAAERM